MSNTRGRWSRTQRKLRRCASRVLAAKTLVPTSPVVHQGFTPPIRLRFKGGMYPTLRRSHPRGSGPHADHILKKSCFPETWSLLELLLVLSRTSGADLYMGYQLEELVSNPKRKGRIAVTRGKHTLGGRVAEEVFH